MLYKDFSYLWSPKFASFGVSWDLIADKDKTIVNLMQKLKIFEFREEIFLTSDNN